MAEKNAYVRMEVMRGEPKFDNANVRLCPWDDFEDVLIFPMEELREGETWDVRFSKLEMTDEEHAAYCAEHGIEVDE